MDHRGRITLPDLVFIVASLAFLAVLWPIMAEVLDGAASDLGTGEAYIFLLVMPVGIVVLFAAIYRTAIAGVGR
jgi:hypothetical protein